MLIDPSFIPGRRRKVFPAHPYRHDKLPVFGLTDVEDAKEGNQMVTRHNGRITIMRLAQGNPISTEAEGSR